MKKIFVETITGNQATFEVIDELFAEFQAMDHKEKFHWLASQTGFMPNTVNEIERYFPIVPSRG